MRGEFGVENYRVFTIAYSGSGPFPQVTIEGMAITNGAEGSWWAPEAPSRSRTRPCSATRSRRTAPPRASPQGRHRKHRHLVADDRQLHGGHQPSDREHHRARRSRRRRLRHRRRSCHRADRQHRNIDRSEIANNSTTANGNQFAQAQAAVVNSGGSSTVTRSTIRGNDPTANVSQASGTGSSSVSGGGIFHVGALDQLLLDRSTVAGNSATANASGVAATHPRTAAAFTSSPDRHRALHRPGEVIDDRRQLRIRRVRFGCERQHEHLHAVVDVHLREHDHRRAQRGAQLRPGRRRPFISAGYNLDSGDTCLGAGSTGDQENTNPQLGPLGTHGGPSLTMAPAINSPAVDKGTAAGAVVDQRGLQRTFKMNPVDAQDHRHRSVRTGDQRGHGLRPVGLPAVGNHEQHAGRRHLEPNGQRAQLRRAFDRGDEPERLELSDDGCSTASVPDNGTCTAKTAFSPVTPATGPGVRRSPSAPSRPRSWST